MSTRTFTKKELTDLDLPGYCKGGKVLSDTITDTSRWSVNHELIWLHPDGKTYRTWYSIAATEIQSERPWEYENVIEATEVHQVERVVKVWEPV